MHSTRTAAQAAQDTEYLNYIRVFACFAVLFLHVLSMPVLLAEDALSQTELLVIRTCRNALNWCVPAFVMITGAVFLAPEKTLSAATIYKKYIPRFLLVILLFGSVYAIAECAVVHGRLTASLVLHALLANLMGYNWDHMWYLYMVIGLYALLPAVKVFTAAADGRTITYTLCVLFVISFVIPFADFFLPQKLNWNFPQVSIYIFYLLLGHAFHCRRFALPFRASLLVLLCYVLCAAFIQTIVPRTVTAGTPSLHALGYDSPLTAAAAWALFSVCRKLNRRNALISFLCPLTFGVYIMHTVPINFFTKMLHWTPDMYSLGVCIGAVSAAAILLSFGGTWILRAIPFVRRRIL